MFWRKRKQSDFRAEIEAHLELEAEQWQSRDGLKKRRARRPGAPSATSPGPRSASTKRAAGSGGTTSCKTSATACVCCRRNPGFAATAILTLALGIGATTAIFSIVDTVMLKPLPFPTADRLVRIRSVIAATGQGADGVLSGLP